MTNKMDWTLGENKPNQTQSRLAPRPALGVEKTKPISNEHLLIRKMKQKSLILSGIQSRRGVGFLIESPRIGCDVTT